MMQRLAGQSQVSLSCSMPKLWPISWATVAATVGTRRWWSTLTPPDISYEHIVPFSAFPTTPVPNFRSLHIQPASTSTQGPERETHVRSCELSEGRVLWRRVLR